MGLYRGSIFQILPGVWEVSECVSCPKPSEHERPHSVFIVNSVKGGIYRGLYRV